MPRDSKASALLSVLHMCSFSYVDPHASTPDLLELGLLTIFLPGSQSARTFAIAHDSIYVVCLGGEGDGTPLQYSCLENPMGRGAWWAAVHGVAKSQARLTSLSLFTFMHWRRKWQPTPVFLPGECQGQRSLVGCRLRGRTESDTTEAT